MHLTAMHIDSVTNSNYEYKEIFVTGQFYCNNHISVDIRHWNWYGCPLYPRFVISFEDDQFSLAELFEWIPHFNIVLYSTKLMNKSAIILTSKIFYDKIL